jgi:sec-independent protein translocase protein TatA
VIGDILQPTHLLFILVVALIVLGPKRLPEVGRSLGKGLRDFRVALNSNEEAEQLRESLRGARDHLQETHETLQQPLTMEAVSPSDQPAEAPVPAAVGVTQTETVTGLSSTPDEPPARGIPEPAGEEPVVTREPAEQPAPEAEQPAE